MRDLGTKMAELKFEAPLAKFEDSDEWGGCDFITLSSSINDSLNLNRKENNSKIFLFERSMPDFNTNKNVNQNSNKTDVNNILPGVEILKNKDNVDNFTETFSGSLEDLVHTFDEKITKCFGNYEQSVEELAPVQVRSQEEIMNECQMWWTITGNFGNILPIDWSKSYTRQMHMPTLQLEENHFLSHNSIPAGYVGATAPNGDIMYDFSDLSNEDEAISNDLDMHVLILSGINQEHKEPIETVEEIIKEINEIMDESTPSEDDMLDSEIIEKTKEVLGSPLYADKLQYLTIAQLNELYIEMEVLIQEFSETLISELALRDEMEYEKELKNTFISLLLAVQNKRRHFHVEKKRGKAHCQDPKYLTTVIPYHMENGTPNNQTLQVLTKILKAINEDSPTVPTLLTDYILKVLCPT